MTDDSDAEGGPFVCAFPACDVLVVRKPDHKGPAPRYCDNPEHNAHSTYHALRKGEGETAPDVAERIFPKQPEQGS